MKSKLLVILASVLLVIGMASVVSAAVIYQLDQTKSGTVTITQPADTITPLKVYSDATLQTEVANLNLSYQSGNTASVTVYVSELAGTVNTVLTNPDGLTITAIPGVPSGGAIPVVISVSGGTVGNHSYSIQFKNS